MSKKKKIRSTEENTRTRVADDSFFGTTKKLRVFSEIFSTLNPNHGSVLIPFLVGGVVWNGLRGSEVIFSGGQHSQDTMQLRSEQKKY